MRFFSRLVLSHLRRVLSVGIVTVNCVSVEFEVLSEAEVLLEVEIRGASTGF